MKGWQKQQEQKQACSSGASHCHFLLSGAPLSLVFHHSIWPGLHQKKTGVFALSTLPLLWPGSLLPSQSSAQGCGTSLDSGQEWDGCRLTDFVQSRKDHLLQNPELWECMNLFFLDTFEDEQLPQQEQRIG